MIYLDNSATTLIKPETVKNAVLNAIGTVGNAGRSFHLPSTLANDIIYDTRESLAALSHTSDPLNIAFTSGATESLNLVINSLIKETDHVITTVFEHNSVLRPLYFIGCELSIIPCDSSGRLQLEIIDKLIKKNTKFFICTHGSNVTGTVLPVKEIQNLCKAHNITFIMDVSQTFGATEVRADFADVICFTGHKGLFGVMGTGGIISDNNIRFTPIKTGGSGNSGFDKVHPCQMPDVFEAGTINTHGLAGLCAGVNFINNMGIEKIKLIEKDLLEIFLGEIRKISDIRIYTDYDRESLPIVSLNIGDLSSEDLSLILWEKYQIATRAGSHCAPLLHQQFGTKNRGMTRFSLNIFNTEEEIYQVISALNTISKR